MINGNNPNNIGPPAEPEGSYEFSFVSACVHPSVRNAVFSELTYYFFLIFCVKLEIRNVRKVTKPDFSEKFSFAQKRAKRAQNGLNLDFFVNFSKLCH